MNESSSIEPSAHHPALFLIHEGIDVSEIISCEIDGIEITLV